MTAAQTTALDPHPQSRRALDALNERLRKESFARKRVMELIPLKQEFITLQRKHHRRYDHRTMRTYLATKAKVADQGEPPDSFLDVLVQFGQMAPDEIFAVNAVPDDIYARIRPSLGPWTGLAHRRAAMLEALRVLAGFESSWNWQEGADTTAGPETLYEQETGAFQVSANSLNFDPSLTACFQRYFPAGGVQEFIAGMKSNQFFSVEYCARLLRFSTKWDGPINRGLVLAWVNRDSVAELEAFLQASA